jgi:hypothetical protein
MLLYSVYTMYPDHAMFASDQYTSYALLYINRDLSNPFALQQIKAFIPSALHQLIESQQGEQQVPWVAAKSAVLRVVTCLTIALNGLANRVAGGGVGFDVIQSHPWHHFHLSLFWIISLTTPPSPLSRSIGCSLLCHTFRRLQVSCMVSSINFISVGKVVFAHVQVFQVDFSPGALCVVVFGLPPFNHPDNGIRATHAALECCQWIDNLGFHCNAALTTGRVFCGAVGSISIRTEYGKEGAFSVTGLLCLHQHFLFCGAVMIGDTFGLGEAFTKRMRKSTTGLMMDEATFRAVQNGPFQLHSLSVLRIGGEKFHTYKAVLQVQTNLFVGVFVSAPCCFLVSHLLTPVCFSQEKTVRNDKLVIINAKLCLV